ncbi:MAG: hypothetical protein M1281_19640 [Chloroflexi bacterium]|nr:hypothetical protein [Chloroflexota bacterium]
MLTCDVCGREIDNEGEKVHLYTAKLISREVGDRVLVTSKTTSAFKDFRPVEVTVCPRHRRELFVQRLMPGVIIFVIFFIPIFFFTVKLPRIFLGPIPLQYLAGVIIDLVLVFFVVRLIQLDGLVAASLTIQEKRKKTGIEYLTEKKYQRALGTKRPEPVKKSVKSKSQHR